MSFELTFSYPYWYILLCLLLGAGYAAILYFRAKDINYGSKQNWISYPLAFFRFAVVSIIAILLLNPLLKYLSEYLERPTIILAVDDSESVKLGMDSSGVKALDEHIADLKEKLSDKFDVVQYAFGEQVTSNKDLTFDQKITDLGMMMEEVQKGWKGQNVSAMVLVSDGIQNQGISPVRIAGKLGHAVYPVALGDTSIRKDLAITEVRTNSIAYLGNTYPVVVDVAGRKFDNEKYEVTVKNGEQLLSSGPVNIDGNAYFRTFEFQLKAQSTGTQQFTVQVTKLKGEENHLNNFYVAYIDVIDSRQKVVMVGSAPHPDLGAIRRTMEPIDNYELIVKVEANPQPGSIHGKNSTAEQPPAFLASPGSSGPIRSTRSRNEANLVILHQVPSSHRDIPFIQDLVNKKIPILFILGRGTDIQTLNKLDLGVRIFDHQGSYNKVLPLPSKDFVLFELSPETREAISGWPPLDVPFGRPAGGEIRPLLDQQIGRVKTTQPLMGFLQTEDQRTGFILGEGFWKWSLQDYNEHDNLNASTELIRKTIQFLSVRTDKRQFRVFPDKRVFYENDMIGFSAELYNESYESVNDPDVNLILRKENEDYEYVFSKALTGYKLNAGMMPAGEYVYRANVQLGGKKFAESGKIVIRALQKERLSLEANHGLLAQIANASGGKVYSPEQIDQLAELLNNNNDLKPIAYSESSFRELLNLKWIFFLLVGLLSLEWGLRKWNGGY